MKRTGHTHRELRAASALETGRAIWDGKHDGSEWPNGFDVLISNGEDITAVCVQAGCTLPGHYVAVRGAQEVNTEGMGREDFAEQYRDFELGEDDYYDACNEAD